GKGRGKENWLLIKTNDEFAQPETWKRDTRRRKTASVGSTRTVAASANARSRPKPRRRLPIVTHPDKVFYPDAGITKGDVFTFYRPIAHHLLPHLRDRPATLEILPDGLSGAEPPHFWQKDTPARYPEWIPRIVLPSERGKKVHYVLINDLATLLYLVN